MYKRVIIAVADGARADLMKQLLDAGELPHLKEHLVDRGCYRTALTVFPSTTGPAHIPFVSGLHPGTANVPGYRWLSRKTHDEHRRSFYRHRTLNGFRGLMVGRDMDPATSTSLFEYYDRPSSVLELIDYCSTQPLYKIVVRRLLRVVQAHRSDDWSRVDELVERQIIKRIKAGSECIIGSFFGIDEYSHLYEPFHEKSKAAYRNIDRAIGRIAGVLKELGYYENTIIAVVSDHGLSETKVHIPLVDLVRDHGFNPHYYPRMYRKAHDCAVLESGNAMAALYFKRGDRWGKHWQHSELAGDERISRLTNTLLNTAGVSFLVSRDGHDGIVFSGQAGVLRAVRDGDRYHIAVEGEDPLKGHPTGTFTRRELLEQTYDATYPDAVNQLFMLFGSERSGDIAISSEPGYDLRLQHEDPEHHGSHGSLHREHMQVPLLTNLPIADEHLHNYDLAATILAATGKQPRCQLDGRVLSLQNGSDPLQQFDQSGSAGDDRGGAPKKSSDLTSILATVAIILSGLIITALFREEILGYGSHLMETYGKTYVDVVLFLLTAVSSTPLALPIWAYSLVGIALGYHVIRL
ncbi:MAG: alkaline phosphatase family protein, partial [candidate division Zixibacteria bacterium]|nr:alkaline phosphatase family protein [candidate division Zixibacteria bacterium]